MEFAPERMSTVHIVYLVAANNGRLRKIVDEGNVLERFGSFFLEGGLLSAIDAYNDMRVESVDMDRFLTEWNGIIREATLPEDGMFLRTVAEMAEECRSMPGAALLFEGD